MPEFMSAEATYISKGNVMFPGTAAQATAAEIVGAARINAANATALAGTTTSAITATGSIKVAP